MPRVQAPARPSRVPELRKGDTVVVLSGRDAGKQGTIERVIRRTANRGALRSQYRRGTQTAGVSVVVTGVNIAKKHTKAPPPKQGRTDRAPKIQQGGILDIAMPMSTSKVMLICPKCHLATRIGHTVLDDGRRIRVCGHCGQAVEVTTK